MDYFIDSDYLIISNKKKCKDLLTAEKLSSESVIEILVSLHFVLEIGLNKFFRQVSLLSIKVWVPSIDLINNLDNISFIDKTILFLYNSYFDFGSEEKRNKAKKYHSIIGKLKNFASTRNKIFHGHSISTFLIERKLVHSEAKKKTSLEELKKQIEAFCFITEGMGFFLDCLKCPITTSAKDALKSSYLSCEFIPKKWR